MSSTIRTSINSADVAQEAASLPKAQPSTNSAESTENQTIKDGSKNPVSLATQSTSSFNSKVKASINKFLGFNPSASTAKNFQNPFTSPMMTGYGGNASSPSSSSPSSQSAPSSSKSTSPSSGSSSSAASAKTRTGSSSSGPSFGNQAARTPSLDSTRGNPQGSKDNDWGRSGRPAAIGGVSVDNNRSNDPLHKGATPENFTIMTASGSRENAKAQDQGIGESLLSRVHSAIMDGGSLGDTLRLLNQKPIHKESTGEYFQTPQLYGAGKDQETLSFSISNPVKNGKGIILIGQSTEGFDPETTATDRKKTIDWMKAIGITDIQEVRSEKEFEAAIKQIKSDTDSSGEKLDLLVYSVIAHGNNSEERLQSGFNDKTDQSYISLDLKTAYGEEDLRGDMEYGASAAKETLALIHSCCSGGIDTDSVASKPKEEALKKPDTPESTDPKN